MSKEGKLVANDPDAVWILVRLAIRDQGVSVGISCSLSRKSASHPHKTFIAAHGLPHLGNPTCKAKGLSK